MPIPLADIAPDPQPVSTLWIVLLLGLIAAAGVTVFAIYLIRRSR
jgi:hypothetical protein